jgi:hypothetical protein
MPWGLCIPNSKRDSQIVEKSFYKHLDVIRTHYGQPRCFGLEDKKKLISLVLDHYNL